ncbi:MAG TPA: hypothetical protein VLZ81_09840, partial [Blastocatellia bacterium]|nr:hypothetical protein [Blastocatellia bacterium]
WLPTELRHIEIDRNSETAAQRVQFTFIQWFSREPHLDARDRIVILAKATIGAARRSQRVLGVLG